MAGARIVNLTVSDVAGDALDAITDPTVQDTTTVADAIAALALHGLWDQRRPPRCARTSSRATPSRRRSTASPCDTVLLVNGEAACQAMAERAAELGRSADRALDQPRGREP